MNELTVWTFEGSEVRTTVIDGEPWWVLRDVCRVLGIRNSRMTATGLDEDQRGSSQIDTPGGKQNVTVVNESGLYEVIIRSDKPQAKAFRKWITGEVLPAIRKTGKYEVTTSSPPAERTITFEMTTALTGVSSYRIMEMMHEGVLKEWAHYRKDEDTGYYLTEAGYYKVCDEYNVVGVAIDDVRMLGLYEPLPPPAPTQREQMLRVRDLAEKLVAFAYLRMDLSYTCYASEMKKILGELTEIIK